jgi:DNA invertase Pin-like site-specific DNA recombinase
MSKQSAYAYLRVSSNGQIEGSGLDRQRESIELFASRNGYEIIETFSDEGVSGTVDGFDRPGLSALAGQLEPGATVIVENADRLARDLLVSEVILNHFRDHRVAVLDTSGCDLANVEGDPTRNLIRQVLGAVAEFNKSQLVGRLARGRARTKKTKGRCEGRKPYENEEVILSISEMRSQRDSAGRPKFSYTAIANRLNHLGYPTPKGGKKWYAATVRTIYLNN